MSCEQQDESAFLYSIFLPQVCTLSLSLFLDVPQFQPCCCDTCASECISLQGHLEVVAGCNHFGGAVVLREIMYHRAVSYGQLLRL